MVGERGSLVVKNRTWVSEVLSSLHSAGKSSVLELMVFLVNFQKVWAQSKHDRKNVDWDSKPIKIKPNQLVFALTGHHKL